AAAAGKLASGATTICSTTSISRCVSRSSPNCAPANSSAIVIPTVDHTSESSSKNVLDLERFLLARAPPRPVVGLTTTTTIPTTSTTTVTNPFHFCQKLASPDRALYWSSRSTSTTRAGGCHVVPADARGGPHSSRVARAVGSGSLG